MLGGCVLLVAAALLLFPYFLPQGRVVIYVDGTIYGTYRMDRTQTLRVESAFGYNLIEITPEGARVTESSCENKLEIKEGRISHTGQSLVCLPNHLVVAIEGRQDLDGFSY